MHKHEWHPVQATCGCELERCSVCQCSRSKLKCRLHQPAAHNSEFYYLQELHGLTNNIPRHTKVCAELREAFLEMGYEPGNGYGKVALDIGAGIGIYAPLLMGLGYRYEALELDPWACKYIKGAYSPHTHNLRYEDLSEEWSWDTIMAAHVLEHLADAPAALEKMYRTLRPGGELYLIVPDDEDLGNPDHLWFFKPETIDSWFREVGFSDVRMVVKQVVMWEKFIYLVGRKPDVEPE